MRLIGKRAIVTAAAQGIGRAIALAFAHEGASVLAVDINANALAALEVEGAPRLRTLRLDVTDQATLDELAAGHQSRETGFNVICNCAGVVHAGTLLECTDDQWCFAWDLNVGAMFRVCRALLPGMIAAGGGSIVNVASVASSVKAVPNRFVYSTTKAAVIGLSSRSPSTTLAPVFAVMRFVPERSKHRRSRSVWWNKVAPREAASKSCEPPSPRVNLWADWGARKKSRRSQCT